MSDVHQSKIHTLQQGCVKRRVSAQKSPRTTAVLYEMHDQDPDSRSSQVVEPGENPNRKSCKTV